MLRMGHFLAWKAKVLPLHNARACSLHTSEAGGVQAGQGPMSCGDAFCDRRNWLASSPYST